MGNHALFADVDVAEIVRILSFQIEIGGFSNLEAQLMIRELGDLNLYGGDLVEVAPPYDPTGNTALTGATLMFEILCVVAQSLSRR